MAVFYTKSISLRVTQSSLRCKQGAATRLTIVSVARRFSSQTRFRPDGFDHIALLTLPARPCRLQTGLATFRSKTRSR